MKRGVFYLTLSLFFILIEAISGCAQEKSPKVLEEGVPGKKGYITKAYKEYFGTPKPIYPNTTYYVVFYSYSAEEPYLAGKVKPIAKETAKQKDLEEFAVSMSPCLQGLFILKHG